MICVGVQGSVYEISDARLQSRFSIIIQVLSVLNHAALHVCRSVGFHFDVLRKSPAGCWENYQRAARELGAILEHIATGILSIILTAPASEVLPKSLAGCWENY